MNMIYEFYKEVTWPLMAISMGMFVISVERVDIQ